jgi:hypothetical protein
MALVHAGFRREFHNAAGLVGDVAAGDHRRAGVVGAHIDFMITALHYHHHAEDTVVWPRLSARIPGRSAEISRMEDAHRAIDDTSERVRATAVQWAKGGDRRLAGELAPLVEEFAGRVDEHFDDEERDVVPLIAEHLTPKEWRKFLAHGSAFLRTHPKWGLALGGVVLDGTSSHTRQGFLANVPLPARAAFKVAGERVYAGYRARVYGPAR